MFCPQCGFQNAEGDGFCGRCGAPLRAPAPTTPPATPASHGAAPSPAGKPNVALIAVVAVAALVLGAGGAYVALRGGPPRAGTPAAPQPISSQTSAQAYADPNGLFKIRYPQGWKVFPADNITVFSQSDIGSAKNFELKQVAAPAIVVFRTEKVNREMTAADVLSASGIEKESSTQIISRRSGNLPTAAGAGDAIWLDFLTTQGGTQIRGRVVYAVRRPGNGTTTKGGAVCVSPPQAFAAFDRGCSAALDSYEFGN